MHAGSRICLGKLRMSTCEGPLYVWSISRSRAKQGDGGEEGGGGGATPLSESPLLPKAGPRSRLRFAATVPVSEIEMARVGSRARVREG